MGGPLDIFISNTHDKVAFFHASKLKFESLMPVQMGFSDKITSASDPGSTMAMITGASPRTENPKPSWVRPLWSCTNLGADQWRFAENIAMGPSPLNRSFTLNWAKSGGVSDSWNLVAAENCFYIFIFIEKIFFIKSANFVCAILLQN